MRRVTFAGGLITVGALFAALTSQQAPRTTPLTRALEWRSGQGLSRWSVHCPMEWPPEGAATCMLLGSGETRVQEVVLQCTRTHGCQRACPPPKGDEP